MADPFLKRIARDTAAATLVAVAAACSHPSFGEDPAPPPSGKEPGVTNLTINISLTSPSGNPYFPSETGHESRTGEELAANQAEKLHTVRIIILDSEGFVEHNTLWDLTADPAVKATGNRFPVKSDDDKTLIFIGNEESTILTDTSTGETLTAARYFSRMIPAEGDARVPVDPAALRRNLILRRAMNFPLEVADPAMRAPLPICSVYEKYRIGSAPDQSDHFYMHRAAAKFTYRLENRSTDGSAVVNSVQVSNAADAEYYFFNAVFVAGSRQSAFSSHTPYATSGTTVTVAAGTDIPHGTTAEIGPVYLPEGPSFTNATDAYRTWLTVNGEEGTPSDISFTSPGGGTTKRMLDLPRNTHVVINGYFTRLSAADIVLNYTVCEWHEQSTDVPPYN